ncbi:MAG: SDR family oxidoreductase [Amphiplicatus sp.]
MAMRVLILGGYGLVGGEILRALSNAGFEIIGLGRDAELGRRLHPRPSWRSADIAALDTAEMWSPYLHDVDAIVNAAGALQNGGRDRLAALQETSIKACIAAAEMSNAGRFVQISAPGASADATTEFLRTKAAADDALRASRLEWVIFKPGLVISANAYGGTALLRMLAALPAISPLVHADASIQTVAASDVARAVVLALQGRVPLRADYDLVEERAHTLREIVRSFREWLGFRPALAEFSAPQWMGAVIAAGADAAGAFGWRSPLRSTALNVIAQDVRGDPAPWTDASGETPKSLDETLADIPSTLQERVFARAQLVTPIAILALSLFWIVSGVIGLISREVAAAHLVSAFGEARAMLFALAGAALDIVIGAGLLFQKAARRFAFASIAVATGYLAAGTLLLPGLWLDPFGVFLKIVPAIILALVVGLLLEER